MSARPNIPSNFKKEYKRYLKHEIKHKELCSTFNITHSTMYRWAEYLKLPINKIKKRQNITKKESPNNFKNIYRKYLNDELTYIELLNKLKVSPGVLRRWIIELNLQAEKRVNRAHIQRDIPKNFKKLWISFLMSEITLDKLCKILKASPMMPYRWAIRLGLPQKREVWFAFKIFNHTFFIKKPFKSKKTKMNKSFFPDFVEY